MAFAALANKIFYHRKRISKLNPSFYNCPNECAFDAVKPFDINRNKFCGDCDVKKNDDRFRASVLELWQKRLGENAKKFSFEKVLSALYSILNLEKMPPDKKSVKTRNLLAVYQIEKNRYEFIEAWNSRQEEKN